MIWLKNHFCFLSICHKFLQIRSSLLRSQPEENTWDVYGCFAGSLADNRASNKLLHFLVRGSVLHYQLKGKAVEKSVLFFFINLSCCWSLTSLIWMQQLLPKYFEVTLLHPHPKGCAASILLLRCPVLIVMLPQSSLVTANKLCKSRARWNSALPGPLEVFKSLK